MINAKALARLVGQGARHDRQEGELGLNDFGVWLFWKLVNLGILRRPFAYWDWRWWQL